MTSTRLPGKVLLPIAGRPMLHHHMQRLQNSGLPVYLATTTNQTDDVLADFSQTHTLPCTRGSEDNVLSRYWHCAEVHALDVIVRVTSDCPLLDGALIAESVREYLRADDNRLYLSNVLERTFPRGLDFEIFSRHLLDEAMQHATLLSDLEHVTPYIHQNRSGSVRFRHIVREPNYSNYRLTVDTDEDFTLIRTLIEQYNAHQLTTDGIISLLDTHPELVALNAHIEQKKI